MFYNTLVQTQFVDSWIYTVFGKQRYINKYFWIQQRKDTTRDDAYNIW